MKIKLLNLPGVDLFAVDYASVYIEYVSGDSKFKKKSGEMGSSTGCVMKVYKAKNLKDTLVTSTWKWDSLTYIIDYSDNPVYYLLKNTSGCLVSKGQFSQTRGSAYFWDGECSYAFEPSDEFEKIELFKTFAQKRLDEAFAKAE